MTKINLDHYPSLGLLVNARGELRAYWKKRERQAWFRLYRREGA